MAAIAIHQETGDVLIGEDSSQVKQYSGNIICPVCGGSLVFVDSYARNDNIIVSSHFRHQEDGQDDICPIRLYSNESNLHLLAKLESDKRLKSAVDLIGGNVEIRLEHNLKKRNVWRRPDGTIFWNEKAISGFEIQCSNIFDKELNTRFQDHHQLGLGLISWRLEPENIRNSISMLDKIIQQYGIAHIITPKKKRAEKEFYNGFYTVKRDVQIVTGVAFEYWNENAWSRSEGERTTVPATIEHEAEFIEQSIIFFENKNKQQQFFPISYPSSDKSFKSVNSDNITTGSELEKRLTPLSIALKTCSPEKLLRHHVAISHQAGFEEGLLMSINICEDQCEVAFQNISKVRLLPISSVSLINWRDSCKLQLEEEQHKKLPNNANSKSQIIGSKSVLEGQEKLSILEPGTWVRVIHKGEDKGRGKITTSPEKDKQGRIFYFVNGCGLDTIVNGKSQKPLYDNYLDSDIFPLSETESQQADKDLIQKAIRQGYLRHPGLNLL